MSNATVVLSDLGIGYKTKLGVRMVAGGINAAIGSHRLTCLLGQNGIGKSTLLRTLAGFQQRLGGSIEIGGRDIDDYSPAELARQVGIVLTERPDVQQMTVREMVAMGRSPYTGFWGRLDEEDETEVEKAIALTGVGPLASRLIATLSDGERQKVMIAKALAQQTPVIYLDEPTAFLDYPSKVEMLLLLRRISRTAGKTVFLSTHDVELALQVADVVWLMEPDSLCIGTPGELAARGDLSRFIERSPGIHFDPQQLTITVKTEV